MRIISFWAWLFPMLLFHMIGCQPSSSASDSVHLPISLQKDTLSPPEALMASAITLVHTQSPRYVYEYRAPQQESSTERQWTRIRKTDTHRYEAQVVYNLYAQDKKTTEYYVRSFRIDPEDSSRRFGVQDYRFVANDDTAYLTDITPQAMRVRGKWYDADGLTVYECEGFEFEQAPEAGHLHYWSPQVGTVLLYFGQMETFELIGTGDPQWDGRLASLRDSIRRQWVP